MAAARTRIVLALARRSTRQSSWVRRGPLSPLGCANWVTATSISTMAGGGTGGNRTAAWWCARAAFRAPRAQAREKRVFARSSSGCIRGCAIYPILRTCGGGRQQPRALRPGTIRSLWRWPFVGAVSRTWLCRSRLGPDRRRIRHWRHRDRGPRNGCGARPDGRHLGKRGFVSMTRGAARS